MKIIQELSERISEEICDAKWYAEKAAIYKDEFPDVSALYARLSEEEMNHMSRIHDVTKGIIKEYREKHGDPPADMMAVYNYLHERSVKEAGEVRALQTMAR